MAGFRRSIGFRHWLIAAAVCRLTIGCSANPIRNDLSATEKEEDLAYVASVFAQREQSFTPATRARFEGGFLTLPNSGLRIHYSDGFHDWRHGFDPQDPRNRANPRIAAVNARYSAAAGSLAPMQSMPLTFHDFATGHDPVMAAIALLLT